MDVTEFVEQETVDVPDLGLECGLYSRGGKKFYGTAVVERIDTKTKTIYFTTPLPAGTRHGDMLVRVG